MTEPDPDDASTDVQDSFPVSSPRAFALTVVSGPDSGLRQVVDARHPTRTLVGSSPACDVRLSDREVSRRHLALDLLGSRLRLTDLGSTNGTRVRGVLVREALLEGGEDVRIGGSLLSIERVAEPARARPPRRTRFGRFVGASSQIQRLYPLIERLAQTDVPVVIEGETGTGKEVLAEAIHESSPRARGPFVVFDCTAVPDKLMESELFGHERGSFTGATSARKGLFEHAHGGTLLIDEIGDLDLSLQPKLLRAIERSEIRRIGSNESVQVDVRLIAATRRDLDREVMAGRFRDDLFHRLAVARIELPPLRERRGDIAYLARYLWNELGNTESIPDALLARWEDYEWPGNVRELRNSVARQLALGELASEPRPAAGSAPPLRPPPEISEQEVDFMASILAMKLPLPLARLRMIEEFERRYIAQALAEHGGNVVHAARASGVARRYFQILKAGKQRAR